MKGPGFVVVAAAAGVSLAFNDLTVTVDHRGRCRCAGTPQQASDPRFPALSVLQNTIDSFMRANRLKSLGSATSDDKRGHLKAVAFAANQQLRRLTDA